MRILYGNVGGVSWLKYCWVLRSPERCESEICGCSHSMRILSDSAKGPRSSQCAVYSRSLVSQHVLMSSVSQTPSSRVHYQCADLSNYIRPITVNLDAISLLAIDSTQCLSYASRWDCCDSNNTVYIVSTIGHSDYYPTVHVSHLYHRYVYTLYPQYRMIDITLYNIGSTESLIHKFGNHCDL